MGHFFGSEKVIAPKRPVGAKRYATAYVQPCFARAISFLNRKEFPPQQRIALNCLHFSVLEAAQSQCNSSTTWMIIVLWLAGDASGQIHITIVQAKHAGKRQSRCTGRRQEHFLPRSIASFAVKASIGQLSTPIIAAMVSMFESAM